MTWASPSASLPPRRKGRGEYVDVYTTVVGEAEKLADELEALRPPDQREEAGRFVGDIRETASRLSASAKAIEDEDSTELTDLQEEFAGLKECADKIESAESECASQQQIEAELCSWSRRPPSGT
jgi:hypothetical protein